MSSIVGHSVTALGIVVLGDQPKRDHVLRIGWSVWLIAVAIAPDLDYFVDCLHPSNNNGLRISHSLLGCLLVPLLTIVLLFLVDQEGLVTLAAQVVLAGISHLLLDMLVGVTALPLVWPIRQDVFRLPFGILPSAGAIALSNYYFYRNLLIEMGVLLPLFGGMYVIKCMKRSHRWSGVLVVVLWGVSAVFMYWGYRLGR